MYEIDIGPKSIPSIWKSMVTGSSPVGSSACSLNSVGQSVDLMFEKFCPILFC